MSNSYIRAIANKPGFVPSQLAFLKSHPPKERETAEIIVHNCKRVINNYGYAQQPKRLNF